MGEAARPTFFPVGGKNNQEKFGEHFTQIVYLATAGRESIQISEGSTEILVSSRAEEAVSEQLLYYTQPSVAIQGRR